MPQIMTRILLGPLALILLASPLPGQQPPPDLILLNGRIFTSDSAHPYVEALAIRGERIVATGSAERVGMLVGPQTKRINLGGRTVIPGINDAHDHLNVAPDSYELPIKSSDPGWQDIMDSLSSAVAKVPKGTWIEGTFGPTVSDDSEATRVALDQLAPDHAVLLAAWTGHASLLNTAAMRKLGVHEDQPNPEGGQFVRNKTDGKLAGMTLEFATFQISRHFSELATEKQATEELRDYFQNAMRLGITTVQNMANPISARRSVALFKKAPPPIRVRVIWFGLTDEHGRLTQEGGGLPRHPVPLVTVSGTKWILDGTPVERSAALREPYADRFSTSGQLNFSQKEMQEMLRESLQTNEQLMVHVSGDRATETFLNAMEATGGAKVWSQRRVRLEHGDGLSPDLVPSAKRLGIIVVQNPTHFALGELAVKRVGEKRARESRPLRSLLDAGIPVAIGSDGPNNPYLNIMLASIYPDTPQQAITREQAVIAYTLTAAFAEFDEKDKGSLEPGKFADLAVLSQDIFSVPPPELPKTESVLTMVGGKIVYDAKALSTSNAMGSPHPL